MAHPAMPETELVNSLKPENSHPFVEILGSRPAMQRRKNAAKGESDFDRLDVAELLLDRVLYNVQAVQPADHDQTRRVTSLEWWESDSGNHPYFQVGELVHSSQ